MHLIALCRCAVIMLTMVTASGGTVVYTFNGTGPSAPVAGGLPATTQQFIWTLPDFLNLDPLAPGVNIGCSTFDSSIHCRDHVFFETGAEGPFPTRIQFNDTNGFDYVYLFTKDAFLVPGDAFSSGFAQPTENKGVLTVAVNVGGSPVPEPRFGIASLLALTGAALLRRLRA